MASLQNAQIDQTYSALLKVGDNGEVNATPKAITGGDGAATNIEMSNTATNFVSGTVDFTGSTVSGLPGGATADVPNIANGGQSIPLSSYGSATYWHAASMVYGRPNISLPAVDQGTNEMLLTVFNIDSTKTVTDFGIPMQVLSNDTLHVGIYETDTTTGGPGLLVKSVTQAVTTADNNTWVVATPATTFTPDADKSYYIGCMTPGGAAAGGLGYVGGEGAGWQRFTNTNNASVGTLLAVNTLYTSTSGTLPSDLSSASFSHRDELAFFAWK